MISDNFRKFASAPKNGSSAQELFRYAHIS